MKPITILNAQGNPMEVSLDATLYREAHDNQCSVAQLLERKFETDASKYGSVLEQVAANCGLFLAPNNQYGYRAPSVASVLDGLATLDAGVVVREANPTSRLIFPAVVLELMEATLARDYTTNPQVFDSLVAITDNIAGNRFEQPTVTLTRPEAARSQGIGQGALPEVMMMLTTSEVARKIPTFSLGLEMTDEAAKATTLDFVTLSLKRQVEAERNARAMGYLTGMIDGDTDLGMSALSSVGSSSLDSASTGGVLTHKAWIKFLYRQFTKRQTNWVLCTLATAMKIEGRTGKPTINTDDPNSPRIDTLFSIANPGIAGNVQMFIVEDGYLADDVIVSLDSRYAIRRVRNSEAQYQAVEQFVLKKTQALRFDFGEICYRLYDDAWDKMTITP